MTTTFTQDEQNAAVAAAVAKAVAEATAPLVSKIEAFEAVQSESESGKAIAAAVDPLNAQIATLQSELDAAVLARTTAEQTKIATDTFWAEAIAASQESEAVAARKEDRLAQVKAAASFPDDYLEKNADRFAAMSDEDFAARVEEWKTIAGKDTTGIPATTGLHAEREIQSIPGSALGELANMRGALSDPRTL